MGFNASPHIFSLLHVHIFCIWETGVRHTHTQAQWGYGRTNRLWSEMNLFNQVLTPALPSSSSGGTLPSVEVRCITVPLSLVMWPSDYMGLYFELFPERESLFNILERINTYKWDPWNHEGKRKSGKTNKRNFCSLLRLHSFLLSYSSHTHRKLLNPKIYKPLLLRWCGCFTSTDLC